ncbi:MAG: S8 family serine peptidase [Paracraurococcus sp.]
MADPKDTDAAGPPAPRRPQSAAASDTPPPAGPLRAAAVRRDGDAPAGDATAASPADNKVQVRDTQYLIAPRTFAGGFQPLGVDALEAHLNALEGVTVVRKIAPGGVGVFALGESAGPGGIMVARATPERGAELIAASQQGAPVIVEHDALLNHHGLAPLLASNAPASGTPGTFGRGQLDLKFRVVGTNQAPLGRAEIRVFGHNFPGQGITEADGTATVSVFGETADSINAVYVKPFADYWERYVIRPHLLTDDAANVIELQPLSSMLPRFPQQQILGWGQELMGLAQVPAHLNGQNVKIAIIDSGCDNTHPQLTHITQGVDLTNPDDPKGWTKDEISHGTHCAGIIAGLASDQQGIRGFAPGAEVLILKVFPGGRFSNLIDALDLCIQRQVDVVNCSLGSGQVSEIVQRKMEEARQKGVACIVAAGNSGGPVQFPATLQAVLSVAAIGQERRFPADSYHAQALMPQMIAANGVFPAKFSCFGPEVKISGPGVAIVSTVPGGGYAAWDGTSMAAPHLTGLAALVLAHHPLFQGSLRTRSAQRVDALFQAIIMAAQPLVADPQRGGAGLPMAAAALGGATQAAAPQPAAPAPAPTPAPAPAMTLAQALGGFAGVPLGALLGQALGNFGGFGQVGGQPPPQQPTPQNGYGLPQGTQPAPWAGVSVPQVLQQLRQLGLI